VQVPQGVIYKLTLDDRLGHHLQFDFGRLPRAELLQELGGESLFTSFCLDHRHAQTSIYTCAQSMKKVLATSAAVHQPLSALHVGRSRRQNVGSGISRTSLVKRTCRRGSAQFPRRGSVGSPGQHLPECVDPLFYVSHHFISFYILMDNGDAHSSSMVERPENAKFLIVMIAKHPDVPEYPGRRLGITSWTVSSPRGTARRNADASPSLP